MPRVFGCMCNQLQRLPEALAAVRATLVAGTDVNRWGVGYVQSGEVLLSRSPRRDGAEVDFFDVLGRLRSDYCIGLAAADPLSGTVNTQPFRYRRWMFAMDGSLDDAASVAADFADKIPGFLQRNIKGKLPAEQIFHLFLSLLHDAGTIDDPNLAPLAISRTIRDCLAMVLGFVTRAGGDHATGAGLGNLVLSNGRAMVAVRLAGPLYMRRLKVAPAPKQPETFTGVYMVSGLDQHPGEGFEEIPPRASLMVSRDLRTDIGLLDR